MVPVDSSVMLEPISRCTQLSRDCIPCTRTRTNFKVRKGHTESINKFHHGSSLRERERETERERERQRERENNHVRKIPRDIYKLYDLS